MTTKQIDYCIELAHTLNFSRAADNMFVSQPTFSYQIRLLEEEIGFVCPSKGLYFDRNKLISSMLHAFDKRQVESADLERIATEIEQSLQNSLEREVTTDRIGMMVMERLKPLDEVAYIRFASVYRRFQNVSEFIHEIEKFLEEK